MLQVRVWPSGYVGVIQQNGWDIQISATVDPRFSMMSGKRFEFVDRRSV